MCNTSTVTKLDSLYYLVHEFSNYNFRETIKLLAEFAKTKRDLFHDDIWLVSEILLRLSFGSLIKSIILLPFTVIEYFNNILVPQVCDYRCLP